LGTTNSCARLDTGSVWCWGSNTYNESGAEVGAAAVPPTLVQDSVGATQIAIGKYHGCSLHADGSVACWGRNDCMQRGDDDATARHIVCGREEDLTQRPQPIPSITAAVEIAGNQQHACARLADGSVSCWGSNALGALGDGTYQTRFREPAPVRGLPSAATRLTAGGDFTVSAGDVYCWGSNSGGQLVWGGAWLQDRPVVVQGLPALR
jgi:alpha-tubulin suppressor-like RCC1 family protein